MVQGQKHPGRWGIVEHQIPSIKVLFKTNNKGHKHPSIRLISKSKTQLVNQRKQKVAFSPGTAHSPEIQSYRTWWGAASPILNDTSGADNCKNRSNYDTSNRFGTNTLWGSLFKKITRAMQNFNMAAIFQDGCHGVSWNVIFCLKNGSKWSKRLLWQHSVCFDHAKCTINVINTIQMFRLFQNGHQFPRWPPWAIA